MYDLAFNIREDLVYDKLEVILSIFFSPKTTPTLVI